MKPNQLYIIILLLGLTMKVNGQTINKKVERLFNNKKNLIEKTEEIYSTKGKLLKSVRTSYDYNESKAISIYSYNTEGQLIKEEFTGLRSFIDNTEKKQWTDTSVISIKHFTYNSMGKIQFEKEYNFQCNLDTFDMIEFIYKEGLLIKKYCTNNCSMKGLGYNYPIYYEYDKNDSIILEKAYGPKDTSKVWYTNSSNYSLAPYKFIFERYYRKDDSLLLEDRTVTNTEYLANGKKSKTIFLERDSSYDCFIYYKNGLLKSKISYRNGQQTWKQVYQYDKRNNIVNTKTYDEDESKTNKLKLNYYQTFKYKYY